MLVRVECFESVALVLVIAELVKERLDRMPFELSFELNSSYVSSYYSSCDRAIPAHRRLFQGHCPSFEYVSSTDSYFRALGTTQEGGHSLPILAPFLPVFAYFSTHFRLPSLLLAYACMYRRTPCCAADHVHAPLLAFKAGCMLLTVHDPQ